MSGASVRACAEAAARFLVGACDPDGIEGPWSDYWLPVGPATDWVTAVVAGALDDASIRVGVSPPGVSAALDAADRFLGEPREGGWGYNRTVEPDADSTAAAARFLLRRRAISPDVGRFLAERQRPDGGFSTYLADDAWGTSHPCVTPVVALVLDDLGIDFDREATLAYVRRMGRADGSWPAYWWRGSHYATYNTLALLVRWECAPVGWRPVVGGRPSEEVRSVLDLACVVGALSITSPGPPSPELTGLLARHQCANGGFPGAPDLRVTHHTCVDPWATPVGQCFADERGLFTTAMVLRVLTDLLSDEGRR